MDLDLDELIQGSFRVTRDSKFSMTPKNTPSSILALYPAMSCHRGPPTPCPQRPCTSPLRSPAGSSLQHDDMRRRSRHRRAFRETNLSEYPTSPVMAGGLPWHTQGTHTFLMFLRWSLLGYFDNHHSIVHTKKETAAIHTSHLRTVIQPGETRNPNVLFCVLIIPTGRVCGLSTQTRHLPILEMLFAVTWKQLVRNICCASYTFSISGLIITHCLDMGIEEYGISIYTQESQAYLVSTLAVSTYLKLFWPQNWRRRIRTFWILLPLETIPSPAC